MKVLLSIFQFIKSNSGIIWSGCGIFILGGIITFSRTHKIIKRNEYDDLLRIRHNYVSLSELKRGLKFNPEFGIYEDKITNEKFCITCIDNKSGRIHLNEETTKFGKTYRCPECHQFFKDKGYYQRIEQAKQDEYIDWQ